MKLPYQLLQLLRGLIRRRIGRLRRIIIPLLIAPVVYLLILRSPSRKDCLHGRTLRLCFRAGKLQKFIGRLQLQGSDTDFLQIGYFLGDTHKGPPVSDPCGYMLCKSSHMKTITDHPLIGKPRTPVVSPVKILRENPGPQLRLCPLLSIGGISYDFPGMLVRKRTSVFIKLISNGSRLYA